MTLHESNWPLPIALLLALVAAGCAVEPDESCEEGCTDEAAEVAAQGLPGTVGPIEEDPVPDMDGDGHPSIANGGDDCNDQNASIHPGAPEVCDDGVDSDCDKQDCLDNGTCQSLLSCKKEKP